MRQPMSANLWRGINQTMPRKFKSNRFELEDANRREDVFSDDFDDEDEIDPEVKDIFEEAQELDYGSDALYGKLKSYTARSPKLTGGDLDASWEYADVGEEAVGGQNPTPDQSNVDDEGKAMGIEYDDDEPLDTNDKLERRDRAPWELDPRSSPGYRNRVKQEFGTAKKRVTRSATPPRKTTRNKPIHTVSRDRQTNKSTRMTRAKSPR